MVRKFSADMFLFVEMSRGLNFYIDTCEKPRVFSPHLTHALIEPFAVVVERLDAFVAHRTMLRPRT